MRAKETNLLNQRHATVSYRGNAPKPELKDNRISVLPHNAIRQK